MTRGRRSLLVVAALMAACAAPSAASAATFTVDSTADLPDVTLDGTCADTNTDCTLRAAIQEANNTSGSDDIAFSSGFDGTTATTITLGSALPTLTHVANITSSGCTSGGLPKPCVALKGDGTFDGITMGSGSSGSSVKGLDFFKLQTGTVDSVGGGTIQGNWFGIDLAGSPTSNANANGVRVLGNSGTIGGTTAATRNVFANDTGSGLSVEGGDTNTVSGNYFGTTPAGALSANLSNHDSIAVASVSGGANTALSNTIGGADTNSNTACDGACNLLGNTVDDEIELGGASVSGGSPAASTTIKGNYVGLQLNGTDGSTANEFTGGSAAIETYSSSVSVTATNTLIGGSSVADRNYIGGNRTGVDTGRLASGDSATIENNYFGIQPDGSGTVAQQFDNIAASGSNTAAGALIKNNLIGSDGFSVSTSFGVAVYGDHVTIQGNTFGVDATGASAPFTSPAIALESGGGPQNTQIGGTGAGEGNVIGNGASTAFYGSGGISISGDARLTTVQGNFIGTDSSGTADYGNTGPGIEVLASSPAGQSSETTIGSDTGTGANVISNNSGPAIAVHQMRDVEIASNRGSGNGGLFIDLQNPVGVGNGPGPGTSPGDGSANGLQAPTITAPSTTSVSGTSVPTATIRVFAKSTGTLDGQLGALIGSGTADGSGNWTVTFGSAQPELQRMVATQTRTGAVTNETSEASSIVRVPDVTPPDTFIDTSPGTFTNDSTPSLTFHATDVDPNITFSCQVDATTPASCSSGDSFGPLADGQHTITVTAKDSSNNADASPASATFTVDTVAPDTFIDTAPGTFTSDSTPTLTFHATDANLSSVTFTCQVDSNTPAACSSGDTFGPLADGQHTITVTAKDGANNVDASPASATFTVDTVAPVTTIDSAPSGTTSDNTPTIAFHATDANGVSFACQVDSGAPAPCSPPATFGPLPDGGHTISVQATDQAGNVESPPKSATFTINTVQPVTPVTSPSPVSPAVKKKCKKKHRAASVAKKKCKKKKH